MNSPWKSFSSKLRKTTAQSNASTRNAQSVAHTIGESNHAFPLALKVHSDAVQALKELLQDKPSFYEIVTHDKYCEHHKLRSSAYKAYSFLVHRNSLMSTGWVVCVHLLNNCCSFEKGIRHFDVSKGGTSSLIRHSESHKRNKNCAFDLTHKLSAGVRESITKGAVFAVVKDMRPLGFAVKGSGLQNYVEEVFKAGQNTAAGVTADVQHLMPSRQTVRNCLAKMVVESRKKFSNEHLPTLMNTGGGVTCDGLKHSITGVKYYDLVAHWPQFSSENIFTNQCDVSIKSQVLMLIQVTGAESASNIQSTLSKGMQERYGISLSKLLTRHTFVTDCASTLPCIVGASSSSKKVPYTSKWMGCICHQLNTSMKRVFDESCPGGAISDILANLQAAKTIVRIFKKSAIKLPSGLHLKQEVETRFSTTFFVVERFLECAQEIREKVMSLTDPPASLICAFQQLHYDTAQEDFATIPALNAIYIVCKPVSRMQKVMEASGKPTLHRLLPMLEHCKCVIGKMADGTLFSADIPSGNEAVRVVSASGLYVRELAAVMLESLNRIEVHPVWCAGSILHPRLALMTYIKDQSRREQYMRLGKAEIRKMMSVFSTGSTTEVVGNNTDDGPVQHNPLMRVERRLAVAAGDELQFSLETALDCPSREPTNCDELTKYIKSTMPTNVDDLMSQDDLGSLRWWIKMRGSYPTLQKVALRVLCTPASSCASERDFSLVNNTVTATRSQLTPDAVEDLVFAKSLLNNGFSF